MCGLKLHNHSFDKNSNQHINRARGILDK
jgi:hypothetical protein